MTYWSQKLHIKKITVKPQSGTKWKTYRLDPHNDPSFAVQFSNSVLKTRAILRFTIKIIEMFELHASMPPMQSAEYQAKILQKFPIIINNYVNV